MDLRRPGVSGAGLVGGVDGAMLTVSVTSFSPPFSGVASRLDVVSS